MFFLLPSHASSLAKKSASCHTTPGEEDTDMEQERMSISHLWQAWPIEGPWHLTPLSGGKNKRVWRVEAANGQCYVLRLVADVSHIPRLRYEAALLEAVSHQQPPFLLPLPLQAHNGDIVVPCEQEAGRWTFATLSPL